MTDELPACQLYLISPPTLSADFSAHLDAALAAGPVAAFQLRLKGVPDDAIRAAADRLMPICARYDVAFIVNDSAAIAKACGADGVHLGQNDGDIREARALLGREAQIGATCHASRHQAMQSAESGADYVAFGSFYPTNTKEVVHHPDPSILTWWSSLFEIPCVAIGGINLGNARPLVEAGADFLAVCGAVWNDPRGAANAVGHFVKLLNR